MAGENFNLLPRVEIGGLVRVLKEKCDDVGVRGPGFARAQLLNPCDQAGLPIGIIEQVRHFRLVRWTSWIRTCKAPILDSQIVKGPDGSATSFLCAGADLTMIGDGLAAIRFNVVLGDDFRVVVL